MTGYKDFHVRLPHDIHLRMKHLSEEKGIALKWLIVSAIEEFLGGGKEERYDEVRKEIYGLKRQVSALRGDVQILSELMSHYIYHWLAYAPQLTREEREALAVQARGRYTKFMTTFARKLGQGELSLDKFLEPVREVEPSD